MAPAPTSSSSWPTTRVPQVAVGEAGGASTERLIISSTWPRTSAGNVRAAICYAVAGLPIDVSNAASSPRHGPVLAMVSLRKLVPRQRNRPAFVASARAKLFAYEDTAACVIVILVLVLAPTCCHPSSGR
jgi:hypothetical protein